MKKIYLLFAFLCAEFGSVAQVWITQPIAFTIPREIYNIFPVNDTVVWASARNCQEFIVTVDGGNTWVNKTIPGFTDAINAMICAVDANTAWMGMWNNSVSVNEGVYKTTDRGDTWTKQSTASFSSDDSFLDIVYFWDADTGVCVGDPVEGEYEIYTTTDGGTNWIRVPGAQIPDPLPGEYAKTSVYEVCGNTIWFSAVLSGRVFKSVDFGNNWTVAETPGGLNGAQTGCPLAFKDQDNGLIMTGKLEYPYIMDYTSDGGLTYEPKAYTGEAFNRSLAYVPGTGDTYASTGFAYGHEGFTFTNDNGNTWITEPNISGTGLMSSAWLNDSVGWVGSFGWEIYKFNNVLALVSDFTASSTFVPEGGSVQFQNLSRGRFTEYNWSFPGGNPSSSDQKIPPPVVYNTGGIYDVSLQVTGLLGTTTKLMQNYIVVSLEGIDEKENSTSSVTIYPNPAEEIITVVLSGAVYRTDSYLSVCDVTGQELILQNLTGSKTEIDVSRLPAGVYFIKLISNDRNTPIGVGKFVKN